MSNALVSFKDRPLPELKPDFYHLLLLIPIILLLSLLSSGCAGLKNRNYPICNNKALQIADNIKNINIGIHSYRGIGWLNLKNGKRRERFRMAFVALPPNKIRLTLMISGLPIETIIADGKKVIFLSHTNKHSLYEIHSPNPSLVRIISIPVRIRDIISLLAGRIPLKEFNCAYFGDSGRYEGKNNKPQKRLLILNKKWNGMIQKIIYHSDNHTPNNEFIDKYELQKENNSLIYSISLNNFIKCGHFKIPFIINLSDNSGRKLYINITAYSADIPLKDSVFSLTEQE